MKRKSPVMAVALAGLFMYTSCSPTEQAETKDYTQYVNTFIGAADNGHTFPGACYPFGMIQTSPVTGAVGWRYCSEYTYQDSLIWGFTQTHLNGTGCMDLGDILVMPVTGTRARAWDAYRSHFPKDKEAATPGYYTVELSDPQVKAELTASIHAALHRYTYHKADSASLLIDLQHGPAWREEQYHSQVNSCEVNWEDAQTLTGHVNNTVWVDQDYFFVMKFNRPVIDSLYLPMGETEKGKRIIATFDLKPGDELMMKVALSTTSVEGAKKNLQAEIPDWNFDGVKLAAHDEWNSYLSRIHGVSVIAEAYRKGFRGFDAERAFNMVKKTQTVSHPLKSDWEVYTKYGYFPTDLTKAESVSSTLESVYDDYAAADMARRMGKEEDAAYFAKRADYYKNLFDSQTNFMRPRKADGTWKSPFNPSDVGHAESTGGDYTEGNAWQYTWHVQHDVPGLIALFGGEEPFLNKLDSLFTVKLETTQADVTGLIGQYAHGNEPSHHVTYLYALAGRPERTQELIREIFDTQYKNKPDGLCGNDDCGQMSAWYMFSAMGFYPVDPVSGDYVFGAPQLPKIVLHLADGKTFTVIAENLSKEHKYVDSITLNGEPYTKNTISHEDILKGGTLVYKMK